MEKKLILKDTMADWRNPNMDPAFIISKDNKLVPVYVEKLEDSNIAIYMNEEDYFKVDHTKSYIFVHNPAAMDAHVPHILNAVNVPIETGLTVNDIYKHHMHM